LDWEKRKEGSKQALEEYQQQQSNEGWAMREEECGKGKNNRQP
jgi:hypothetical protein